MRDESETGDQKLDVVFMGTPDFAVPALEAIAASRHRVVGVVTKPDRARGRGRDPRPSAVKSAAVDLDLPVFQPESIDTDRAVERLRGWSPDVAVVAAYGHILPPRILELPPRGCLNIHASLLPNYRGAAPINWAIVRGESETGVSIMKMDEGLDTGPVASTRRVEIGPRETAGELHDRLAQIGAQAIVSVLEAIGADELELTPQNDDEATRAPKLSTSDGRIDWEKPAGRVADEVRGFNPWPGAFSHLPAEEGSDRIKFHLADAVEGEGAPGEVLEADPVEDQLRVACGDGAISCLEIQAPGRRAMGPSDFLNGYDLQVGDRFGGADADA